MSHKNSNQRTLVKDPYYLAFEMRDFDIGKLLSSKYLKRKATILNCNLCPKEKLFPSYGSVALFRSTLIFNGDF